MMKFSVWLLLCSLASVSATDAVTPCCQHAECGPDHYCNSRHGCRFHSGLNGNCVAKLADGERVEALRITFAYYKCLGGTGACGYCSSTCASGDGCQSVPRRGGCSSNSHCQDGLFCDWGTDYVTAGCNGVCLEPCRTFDDTDKQRLCEGVDALMYSRMAYTIADHHCCSDGAGQFAYSRATCERNMDVLREDCEQSADCWAACARAFTEHHQGDVTDAEWNAHLAPLRGLRKHTRFYGAGVRASIGRNILYEPFGFTAHRGSTMVIAFKGSDEPGDFFADISAVPVIFTIPDPDGGQAVLLGAHSGFTLFYEQIREAVLAAVEQTGSETPQDIDEFLITGHSLGGAMANLCAVDLAIRYPGIKVSLRTYGAPRVFIGHTGQMPERTAIRQLLQTVTVVGSGMRNHVPNSANQVYSILTSGDNSHHRYMAVGDLVVSLLTETMFYMHAGDGLELNAGGSDACRHCHVDHTLMAGGWWNHFGTNYYALLNEAKPAQCPQHAGSAQHTGL